MHWKLRLTLLVGCCFLLTSCGSKVGTVFSPAPSVYYWRTTFELTPTQRQWLQQEHVGKLYLRLFDIVGSKDGPIPNATITFGDTLPQGVEVIPTIFIDYALFRNDVEVRRLAQQTLERIAKMAQTHGFAYSEVQFDCDWTQSTQKGYFDFLESAARYDTSLTLSSTIRLHQLSMTPPPVDYGALMLYNTGDFRKADSGRNPILDAEDVKPYLRYLSGYQLPLCAAYPNFDWKLLFHQGEFAGMLYQEDLSDPLVYLAVDSTTYTVIAPLDIAVAKNRPYLHLTPGDMVKYWKSDPQQIEQVREMVASKRKHINDQIIIYHLSEIE